MPASSCQPGEERSAARGAASRPGSPARDGSYVAIYWIHEDHYDDHVEWATEQVNWLYPNDRGYAMIADRIEPAVRDLLESD